MKFRFTKHAIEKFAIMRSSGFRFSRKKIVDVIDQPHKIEDRPDGTYIAMIVYD